MSVFYEDAFAGRYECWPMVNFGNPLKSVVSVGYLISAVTSTSISAPLGSDFTATAERAG